MLKKSLPLKACHNCRRKRLQCDRSMPSCLKCINAGNECLGYGLLLRWQSQIGCDDLHQTYQITRPTSDTKKKTPLSLQTSNERVMLSKLPPPCLVRSLVDPILSDQPRSIRLYLAYFVDHVCKDLVLYNDPKYSPYHGLLSLSIHHRVLYFIIIASAARHMHNRSRSVLVRESLIPPVVPKSLDLQEHSFVNPLYDSMAAESSAVTCLITTLKDINYSNIDAILAALLLFIEYELMELSQDTWRKHMNGARSVINLVLKLEPINPNLTLTRISLLSNWLVYDTLASILVPLEYQDPTQFDETDIMVLLCNAETNNYLSCPATLLHAVRQAARISRTVRQLNQCPSFDTQRAVLLHNITQFDARAWAERLQQASPQRDLSDRMHLASAHKAAVYIYVYRILQKNSHSENLEHLVQEITSHISMIPLDSALTKATPWPVFIAGAETTEQFSRDWVASRLSELWEKIPWGYVRNALMILRSRWQQQEAHNASSSYQNWDVGLSMHGYEWFIC